MWDDLRASYAGTGLQSSAGSSAATLPSPFEEAFDPSNCASSVDPRSASV